MKSEILIRGDNNKVIGIIIGDELYKNVRGSAHFLHVPPAICFDVRALDEAHDNGATIAHVYDKEKKRDYFALISTIKKVGFRFNRGYGDQIGLAISYWSDKRPPTPQMKLF